MREGRGELVVFITAPAREGIAERLAHELVQRRLAACVNLVGQVRSVYRWQGKIEEDAETLLVVKTRRGQLEKLNAALTELHPYQVPECLALEVVRGRAAYLDWLTAETE